MATVILDSDGVGVEINAKDYVSFELSRRNDFVMIDEVLENEYSYKRTGPWSKVPGPGGEMIANVEPIKWDRSAKDTV